METAARFFDHAQRKLRQVLEHEMPNIQTAADFVTESCKRGGKFDPKFFADYLTEKYSRLYEL